mgnify:FL=1|jgi:hypothetical protein|tara:strand:- start:26 stop:1000 length:975 start_codon:yes stop_codon:yes gene_type:complete
MKKIRYQILYSPKYKFPNFIVILAIGNKYFLDWKKFSSSLLIKYCKKNKIGLLVIKDYLIEGNDYYAKKATIHKLLIGSFIEKKFKYIKNICYLDTDIIVNPFSPNVFNFQNKNKINVVSRCKNLPYYFSDNFLKRRVAFLRKENYDKNFPLDSGLTISPKKIFTFHGWKDQGDYFNAGLLMFNVKKFSNFFLNIFNKYRSKNFISMTGGDEPIVNYEVLKSKKVHWMSYKFNVLWLYEMSCRYPFLYEYKIRDTIIKKCIETTLSENYFIHFSGTWPEGLMWKNKNLFGKKKQQQHLRFVKYLKKKLRSISKKTIVFKNFKKI